MYRLIRNAMIVRLSDRALIPPDPANADYALYLDWLKGGNIPESIDESLDDNDDPLRPVHRPRRTFYE